MPSTNDRSAAGKTPALSPLALFFFSFTLLVTLTLCLRWSHARLFWVDELLEYYTDVKPSTAQVIAGQLHAPFSLEPPAFHVLLHLMHRVIPAAELAARLPSMIALLVTEAACFLLTFRLSKSQATSFVAMLIPFYLVTVDYGVEARVYSTLTACLAVALFCWAYLITGGTRRRWALAGLTVALGGAILMHYFSVFLLVPFYAGEALRTLERRKLDRATLAALLLSTAPVLLNLPFQHALAPFRLHYYNTGESDWFNLPFTYEWFYRHFLIYGDAQTDIRKSAYKVLLLMMLLIGAALWRARSSWRTQEGFAAVEVALIITALLPVLNLTAAQVTKTYVPRYSLPTVVGLALLTALLVKSFVVLPRVQIVIACLIALKGVQYLRDYTGFAGQYTSVVSAQLSLTPQQQAALAQLPDQHIYMQDVARQLFFHYYLPAPYKEELVGTFSPACELKWRDRDPASLFARNMAATAKLPFLPFWQLRALPGPHLLVVYHDPKEEWIEDELRAAQVQAVPLGKAFGGDLIQVTLPSAATCDAAEQRASVDLPHAAAR